MDKGENNVISLFFFTVHDVTPDDATLNDVKIRKLTQGVLHDIKIRKSNPGVSLKE